MNIYIGIEGLHLTTSPGPRATVMCCRLFCFCFSVCLFYNAASRPQAGGPCPPGRPLTPPLLCSARSPASPPACLQVVRVDRPYGDSPPPLPSRNMNYRSDLCELPPRQGPKPIDIVQPEGPSWEVRAPGRRRCTQRCAACRARSFTRLPCIGLEGGRPRHLAAVLSPPPRPPPPPPPLALMQVDGNLVKWQRWQVRLSFNYREGLVLHNVAYEDGGRLRPVMHRRARSPIPCRDRARHTATPGVAWRAAEPHVHRPPPGFPVSRRVPSSPGACCCAGRRWWRWPCRTPTRARRSPASARSTWEVRRRSRWALTEGSTRDNAPGRTPPKKKRWHIP
jgi:hypothetical protein